MKTLLLLLFTAMAALAQPRDFFPWWEMPIVNNIGLSEDQRRQIQTTVREYRDKLVDQRGAIEKAENQLSDIMNEDHPDERKAAAAIDRVAAARADLTRTFSQMGFRLRMVLTPGQWKDLQMRRAKPPLNPQNPRPNMRNPRPMQNEDGGPFPPNPRNPQNPRPRVFEKPELEEQPER